VIVSTVARLISVSEAVAVAVCSEAEVVVVRTTSPGAAPNVQRLMEIAKAPVWPVVVAVGSASPASPASPVAAPNVQKLMEIAKVAPGFWPQRRLQRGPPLSAVAAWRGTWSCL